MESLLIKSSAKKSAAKTRRLLTRAFYARNSVEVAQELLGKILEIRTPEGTTSGRIVETEAYRRDDPACHAYRGETKRAAILFGKPGVAYVYFIYGMYEMLNFVTEPKGDAGAVLIRALEPLEGQELMKKRRGKTIRPHEFTNGPGKLCRAMGVLLSHNGASLAGPELRVFDDGFKVQSISESPRVGISQGTEHMWRYFITGNTYVSRAPENKKARVL